MKDTIHIRCPCCEKLITLVLDSGHSPAVFLNTQKQEEIDESLSKLGYEFGVTGGEQHE